jgi:SAM-dependent methyltransferase
VTSMVERAQLEKLRTRPYPLEPPRQSRRVDAVMALSRRLGVGRPAVTPHLHGGTNLDKIRYEYDNAEVFWELLDGVFDRDELRDRDILDLGCGWGGKMVRYAETLGPRSIVGLDLPGMIDIPAAERFAAEHGTPEVRFVTGTAEDLPFADRSFDVVYMDDVLEHVREPSAVLAEAFRVLRAGGRLVARFPSVKGMMSHHLDRAITLPAVHYLIPLAEWAAGLNHYLIHNRHGFTFEPVNRVVATRFQPAITENLNGMTLASFTEVAEESPFAVERIGLVEHPAPRRAWKRNLAYPFYAALWRFVPRTREFLALSIVFVGRRPAAT